MASGKSRDAIYVFIIIMLIVTIGHSFRGKKNQPSGALIDKSIELSAEPTTTPDEGADDSGQKTFVFKSFHGADLGGGGFTFQYPANWHNDSQYFSPIPIKYYDLVSVDAPVYFDLISTLLFDTSGLKYQIAEDKRKSADSRVKIDGKTFDRYDLIDYGSSGGESTGRVIIYLGPEIGFGGDKYYLVFRWEENPLTVYVPGNDLQVFENMVLSLKFL